MLDYILAVARWKEGISQAVTRGRGEVDLEVSAIFWKFSLSCRPPASSGCLTEEGTGPHPGHRPLLILHLAHQDHLVGKQHAGFAQDPAPPAIPSLSPTWPITGL